MITVTFPDTGLRPGAVTIAVSGDLAETPGDLLASDAILDAALENVFVDGAVRLITGAVRDGDPLLAFWRRQIARVVHTHPRVGSGFATWEDDVLRWHWRRAAVPQMRRAAWEPFCDRAAWERTCVPSQPQPVPPEPTTEDVARAERDLREMKARLRASRR